MRIIGIDPGYAIVGYGVVEYVSNRFTTFTYGAIKTSSDLTFQDRLTIIYDDLNSIIGTYKPNFMAIEKIFFTNNKKTAFDVAQARGVIMLSASKNNIQCYEYTPLQVKQAVVGYGKAEKRQIMNMTKTILNLGKMPKYDDTSDALAVAICHAHALPSLINLKRIKGIL